MAIGDIRSFAFGFMPHGWLECDGRLLSTRDYAILYSVIGGAYGEDGRGGFRLPDLRGRALMGAGDGIGLTPRPLGQASGEENVRLTEDQMPPHSHQAHGRTGGPTRHNQPTPGDRLTGLVVNNIVVRAWASPAPDKRVAMHPETVGLSGGGAAHENRQPYLTVAYGICFTDR